MTFDRREAILKIIKEQFPDYPCFFGYDFIPALKGQIASGEPFIYADHAYFGRGYPGGGIEGNFRVILSDVHRRDVVPRDSAKTFVYEPKDWRRGEYVLVFPPSETMVKTFEPHPQWAQLMIKTLKKYTARPVFLKPKHAKYPLSHYLENAHAVIGFGTVACVEAAMFGVPVFAGPKCPATPIAATDLTQIDTPIYPDREAWFRNLTWSQFHLDEIRSGLCREVLLGRH